MIVAWIVAFMLTKIESIIIIVSLSNAGLLGQLLEFKNYYYYYYYWFYFRQHEMRQSKRHSTSQITMLHLLQNSAKTLTIKGCVLTRHPALHVKGRPKILKSHCHGTEWNTHGHKNMCSSQLSFKFLDRPYYCNRQSMSIQYNSMLTIQIQFYKLIITAQIYKLLKTI